MRKCPKCQEVKSLELFDRNKHLPLGRCYTCKACRSKENKLKWDKDEKYRQRSKEAGIKHRTEKREHVNTKNEEWRKKASQNRKEYVNSKKKAIGCSECGYAIYAPALEYHHIDPSTKKLSVGTLVHKGASIKAIDEEIAKCVLLCANCHRAQHSKNI